MNWKQLNNMTDLENALAASHHNAIAIFKHSTRCGISSFVLKNFERTLSHEIELSADLYFLDLIAHRDVSNAVAEKLEVIHESPQLIIIENSKAVHHASHHSIDAKLLIAKAPS